ncbi:hypothetical protein G7085_04915 [Tessaracoccus sp. HDW20]|uniref:hypothetical protein n=1 Tax=Tessaracoccus coleopterorum TaxID=2714950 RepID=UPI0018D290CC|nr:hypothetical protein [Tessaracoccus coleopterorum]NHB84184.1 hypothetical protein [Tessaracoccus coleopterorum]
MDVDVEVWLDPWQAAGLAIYPRQVLANAEAAGLDGFELTDEELTWGRTQQLAPLTATVILRTIDPATGLTAEYRSTPVSVTPGRCAMTPASRICASTRPRPAVPPPSRFPRTATSSSTASRSASRTVAGATARPRSRSASPATARPSSARRPPGGPPTWPCPPATSDPTKPRSARRSPPPPRSPSSRPMTAGPASTPSPTPHAPGRDRHR